MVSCAASITRGFKALRSGRREDTPTQYHRSPVRSAGALKDSTSTPSVARTPKQRTNKRKYDFNKRANTQAFFLQDHLSNQ